jgi:DNA invertase Pin-like site-specific DNA recombinase
MRAAIYVRVSTDKQDSANQEPDCLQVCAARGWEPTIFREEESAVKRRPVWSALLERCRVGAFEALVFWSISRIGRRRVQIAADLADLTRWGLRIVSVREAFLDIDQSPELAKLRDVLVHWLGWFAELERDMMIEKTNASLARVKRTLERTGQYTSPHSGRTIVSLGRPPIYAPMWRARARELHTEDLRQTPNAIARKLAAEGCHADPRTVQGWITS